MVVLTRKYNIRTMQFIQAKYFENSITALTKAKNQNNTDCRKYSLENLHFLING